MKMLDAIGFKRWGSNVYDVSRISTHCTTSLRLDVSNYSLFLVLVDQASTSMKSRTANLVLHGPRLLPSNPWRLARGGIEAPPRWNLTWVVVSYQPRMERLPFATSMGQPWKAIRCLQEHLKIFTVFSKTSLKNVVTRYALGLVKRLMSLPLTVPCLRGASPMLR